ncbi:MAG: hypothetical protein IJO40_14820 [Thermoguttaceae bacterium]|nr:hypothetical protein [Thermoguttaceae bacterium]
MKTMASAFLTNDRRSLGRRFSTAFVRLCVGAAVASLGSVGGEALAQGVGAAVSSDGASAAYESRALFVPSLDLESPTVFSSVDAARRNRPPQPAKRSEELLYPEGFLTLSAPTPEPIVELPVEETKDVVAQETPKKEEPPRRLDPFAETTPLAPPPEPEPPKKEAGDQILFFALSFALAALGGFIYVDYRYRDRLKADLARNARLRLPNACAADFDELLISADGERFDPTFDDLSFLANPNASTSFDDEEAFEPIVEPTPPTNGPGLSEENFDFAPSSATNPRAALSEPEEDFVVGAR